MHWKSSCLCKPLLWIVLHQYKKETCNIVEKPQDKLTWSYVLQILTMFELSADIYFEYLYIVLNVNINAYTYG